MKHLFVIVFAFTAPHLFAQDPWKNVYAHHAWVERDKWQRADDLISLMSIAKGARVADVGCHEGYMTFKLARHVGITGTVYAVDLDEGKLEKVKSRAKENQIRHITAIKGRPDDPGLPANTLDAVILLDTYHEIDEYKEMLRHVGVSLKPGGRLLICDPIADARRGLSREEQERRHELAMHFAIADLEDAGYKVVFQRDNFIDRTREKGDVMWVVVAEKN